MSYTIGGNNFSSYNMKVTSSMGALDFPKRLGDIDHDWKDTNGVEAFTEAANLLWDGREIDLLVYYSGSDLDDDLATFRGLYEGTPSTLVTTYGTHTATLRSIKTRQVYEPNGKAVLLIKFWEPSVTVPSVPSVIGGSGVTLGGYDLYQDFELHVASTRGLFDFDYRKEDLTYGDQPAQYSDNRKNRRISIYLNGVYSNLSNLTTNINELHAVLRSAGLKALSYHGISENVYFADRARVSVILQSLAATVRLPLRISE